MNHLSRQGWNYMVYFNFGLAKNVYTAVPSLAEVKDGFWIDEKGLFTKTFHAKTWIPPAQILYVEKINKAAPPQKSENKPLTKKEIDNFFDGPDPYNVGSALTD